jgi:hypothetical protein
MKKILTLSLTAAAFLASGWQVSANSINLIANGTYVFTETDGLDYGCTGSTVTFNNDAPTSWDIIINSPGAPNYDQDTYTPLNSVISAGKWGGVLAPDEFVYYLQADIFDPNGNPSASITWNVYGNHIYDNPSWSLGPLDPTGTWTLPDGGMTASLLGGALIGLQTLRRKLFCQ